MSGAVVSVVAVERDLRRAVREALDLADFTQAVPAGADVSLKVNLGWDLFVPGAITSPYFAEALIDAIRDHVGTIYLVESDQVLEDVELAFARSGMAEVCRRTGVRWVNMGLGARVLLDMPDNAVLQRVDVPQILRDTVLITVPVMKTHAKTGLSGALKNQWGCLPRMRHEYHLVLDDAIADLNAALRPAFAAMDATIGLEGNGPKSGFPRLADRVLCSADPVALDTVQALSMGLDPKAIRHLQTCADRGLGANDPALIEVRGLHPGAHALNFRPARHNAVSAVETLLRGSALKRLFFDTPLFVACLRGAKLYYRMWTALNSRRAWAVALQHPYYGPLWRDYLERREPSARSAESVA